MIEIRTVPVAEVIASKELIAEYAAECSIPGIGKINPQRPTYDALEAAGLLRSWLVFEGDKAIGLAMALTTVLPHYGEKVATLESLFVTASKRAGGAGRDLMRAVEGYAAEVGCVGILYSAPAGGQLEKLLEVSKAYQRTNTIFYRRLR